MKKIIKMLGGLTKDECKELNSDYSESLELQNSDLTEKVKELKELLFLMTDLMHDEKVFEKFSHKEISEAFLEARLYSRYGNKGENLNDLKEFVKDFAKNVYMKLEPNYERK